MRWVLIRPLHRSQYYDPETQEPLGLEYLDALLKSHDQETLLIDSSIENISGKKLARRAISFKPDVICFSITTDRDIASVIEIYDEVQRICQYSLKWLAGGNFVTVETKKALSVLPPEFMLVKYEGEIALQKLMSEWTTNTRISRERVIEGGIVEDLDSLPFPSRPYASYLQSFGWAFNLVGSRGCCSSCRYCASSGMRNRANTGWRGRSPENIAEELAVLNRRFGASVFNFVDEDFLGPPHNARERASLFLKEIQKRDLQISYGIQVRPNSLTEDIINLLVESGLHYVFMGIESDNPLDLKRWGRVYCKDTWKWVALLQQKGVEVNAGTLLFHPQSTINGVRSFAERLVQYNLLNCRTAINRLDAMPGSQMHKAYEDSDEIIPGIFQLPFDVPEIENLYDDIIDALTPLEPVSMHAICILPQLQIQKRFSSDVETSFMTIKEIIRICDKQVERCFFQILEKYENEMNPNALINVLREENRELSYSLCNQLVDGGFVRTPDVLYRAIDDVSI